MTKWLFSLKLFSRPNLLCWVKRQNIQNFFYYHFLNILFFLMKSDAIKFFIHFTYKEQGIIPRHSIHLGPNLWVISYVGIYWAGLNLSRTDTCDGPLNISRSISRINWIIGGNNFSTWPLSPALHLLIYNFLSFLHLSWHIFYNFMIIWKNFKCLISK